MQAFEFGFSTGSRLRLLNTPCNELFLFLICKRNWWNWKYLYCGNKLSVSFFVKWIRRWITNPWNHYFQLQRRSWNPFQTEFEKKNHLSLILTFLWIVYTRYKKGLVCYSFHGKFSFHVWKQARSRNRPGFVSSFSLQEYPRMIYIIGPNREVRKFENISSKKNLSTYNKITRAYLDPLEQV